ncbi:MAG: N(4)-(beta-N-acetylglucosaminyl)-L-asparaginase [Bacteroidia bacterium]|nr:N(4)-(beta-N-acetylglucosaminyl)-L-asparaginase [Bacteroidia bacterium]
MSSRRKFLKLAALGAGALGISKTMGKASLFAETPVEKGPVVISTWNHGMPANRAAWTILRDGGTALDAVEQGVRVVESDPESTSVGYGGRPDRDGHVTLDACIMDHLGNCGGVAFLEHIKNPISVARKVMEDTPHVLFAGEGALEFALSKGFVKENLLTEDSRLAWQEWLKTSQYKPIINVENHDTIGMLALDLNGNLSGACTTSGLAYKPHGRVGDSPIIGAGLFVDNEIGAACATGMGEAVIRVAGSHTVVEMMRQGHSPTEACRLAVLRVIKKHDPALIHDLQVGFLALNKKGEYGGYAIHKGFNFALRNKFTEILMDAGAVVG